MGKWLGNAPAGLAATYPDALPARMLPKVCDLIINHSYKFIFVRCAAAVRVCGFIGANCVPTKIQSHVLGCCSLNLLVTIPLTLVLWNPLE